MKNIVLCCDGTGNEYGDANSNVVKLYRCLSGSQVVYYHPGVGTMGDLRALSIPGKIWTKFRGLAFGYGLSDNIADAYRFLMQVFEDGDAVFIFGFSRGAYTARALCGLLEMVGLLRSGNEGMIPYAMRLFKRRDGLRVKLSISPNKFRIAAGFKSTFSRECKPHFLGVWDTVSSVGWILDPVGLKPGSLPYTYELRDVATIRHAVSLDERRAFFRTNLVDDSWKRDIKQVWFAGVHSDVGGSYPEAESGLSKISLSWMLTEAVEAGLSVDTTQVNRILDSSSSARPLASAKMHNSLTPAWWLGEFWPKFTKRRISPPGVIPPLYRGRPRLNLFRRRFVPPGSCIHESVQTRMKIVHGYAPSNLPASFTTEPDRQSISCNLHLMPQQTARFGIFARLPWNDTTLQVTSGEIYELCATGTWYDASLSSDPSGYSSPKALMSSLEWLRRRPKDKWFALIGATDRKETQTFLIGTQMRWTVPQNGQLYCYANDVPYFYFNNSGVLILHVTRVS